MSLIKKFKPLYFVKNRVAVGLATLVTGKAVYHPDENVHAIGTGIDYWTEPHLDDDDHRTITERLLGKALTRGDSAFATLKPEEESAARGIAERMRPIGHVAMLQAIGAQYGAAVRTSPLQLYTF